MHRKEINFVVKSCLPERSVDTQQATRTKIQSAQRFDGIIYDEWQKSPLEINPYFGHL
jgi:hypothetical protein